MTIAQSAIKNPYVGPQPFQQGQPLFGRDREVLEIKYLLTSERVVLLYSPSGAGKSSLVNAGLRGKLAQRFEVLGPTRVNSQHIDPVANRYVWSAISGIEESAAPPDITWQSYVAGKTWKKNPLFIFDQFEEILRVDSWDTQGKREFFEQLGQVLSDPRIWALFILREDYLAPLDPYAHLIPTNLYNRYRLDRLTIDMAVEAIEKPTADTPRKFKAGVVKDLAENLAKVKVNRADGTTIEKIGDYVEPLQLQVVCFDLWGRMADDQLEIGTEDVGDVGDALSNYYAHCVETAAASDTNAERRIRDWFNDKLITADGVRNQVRQGAEDSGGLENALVRELVDTYLIRPEPRGSSVWYELSHDRLVDPIRQSNRKWFAANLIPVQQRAVEWLSDGRPESLLLDDDEMADAELWAKDPATVLMGPEREFLQACRNAQRERQVAAERVREAERFERLEAERVETLRKLRTASRFRKLTYVAAVCAAFAIGFAVLSGVEHRHAIRANAIAAENKKEADQQLLAATALLNKDTRPGFAGLVSLEGFNISKGSERSKGATGFDIRNALLSSLQAHLGLVLPLQHGAEVMSVAFSPDGKLFATASSDLVDTNQSGGSGGVRTRKPVVRIWDVAKRQKDGEPLLGHEGEIKAIAFSPNGDRLASAGADKTVRLWSTQSRALLREMKGHTRQVTSISFSPDGRLLASASSDQTVRLWNADTGMPVGKPLKGHVGEVLSVAFSPNGQLMASASDDWTVQLWNVIDQKPAGELQGHFDKVTSVAFGPDGNVLASASADQTIQFWDLKTLKPLGDPLTGHSRTVLSIAFSRNGKFLASASGDETVRIWNAADRQPLGDPLRGHTSFVTSVVFSPDSKQLVSASVDGTVRFLQDVENRKSLGSPVARYAMPVRAAAFSPDGETIASAGDDGTIQLTKAGDGKSKIDSRTLEGRSGTVWSIAFSPNGRLLASASMDGMVRLWDRQSGKLASDPARVHRTAVRSVAFRSDSKVLAFGGQDKTIHLLDPLTRRQIGAPLVGHKHAVTSVAFSPNGKLLASASDDQTVQLWNAEKGQSIGPPMTDPAGGGFVVGVTFSPDGRLLASAHFDGSVRFWDVATQKQMGDRLRGHSREVWSVAFSPDGKTVATSSADGTVRLWDVERRLPLGDPLRGHSGPVRSVAFSANGKKLVSASEDGSVWIWDVDLASWVDRLCPVIGRNLFQAEWSQYFEGEAYRRTCPQFPSAK